MDESFPWRAPNQSACVEDGMVVEGDFVADSLGARIQLGVLPKDSWTKPHR